MPAKRKASKRKAKKTAEAPVLPATADDVCSMTNDGTLRYWHVASWCSYTTFIPVDSWSTSLWMSLIYMLFLRYLAESVMLPFYYALRLK